jgi:hypothetical protein
MDLVARIAAGLARLTSAINAVDAKASAGALFSTVMKTADETKTANVTLAADALLKKTLTVGQYRIKVSAFFSTANATMDFKYDTNFTGTATYKSRLQRHVTAGALAGTDSETVTIGSGVVPSTAVAATTTGIGYVELELVLVVTVAGEFQFRWAQNTSDAGLLTCTEGSYLETAPC